LDLSASAPFIPALEPHVNVLHQFPGKPGLLLEGVKIMNKLALLALTLSAVVSSTSTFAQPASVPLTRAQVRAELIRLEQAGYNPSASDDVTYPADIQAAEAKVAAQDAEQQAATPQQQNSDSGMGAEMKGTSDSGRIKQKTARSDPSTCVGPVSFCNIFFGN
jgi:hypothetical protein